MTALSNFTQCFYLSGLPVPLTSADRLLDQVDGGVVLVGGDFVTDQVPHALLDIQFRMIRWQVLDIDVAMCGEEFLNSQALMPGSPINVEIDFRFADSIAEVF